MNRKSTNLLIIGLLVLFVIMVSGCVKSENTEPEQTSKVVQPSETTPPILEKREGEKFIARIDPFSWFGGSLSISQDGKRVAVAAQAGNKEFVVIDGKEEKQYDIVEKDNIFSPDSNRVAYVAEMSNKQLVVVDGIEGKQYDGIGAGTHIFSPDGKRLVYVAILGNKQFIIEDVREEKQYDGIGVGTPIFSPDSKRFAYAARAGNKWFVVVDGKEEKQYDGIVESAPIFSPDSQRMAYGAIVGNKQFVVVDGKEEKQYDGLGIASLIFSPDGKRIAYVAIVGNKQFVVVDGKEEKQYDCIMSNVSFSSDSKRVAYVAKVGNKRSVVIDGKEEKLYDGVEKGYPIFSPDSNRVAYPARAGNKWFVVVDGKEEKQYDSMAAYTLTFSHDSRQVAYGVRAGDKWFVIAEGKEGKQHDGIRSGSIIFSPDSKLMAYVAKVGNKEVVVVDGKEEKHYDGIMSNVLFSSDSKHLVYVASERDREFVVADGIERKHYSAIATIRGRIIFDSPDRIHYTASKDSEIYLVEENLNNKVASSNDEINYSNEQLYASLLTRLKFFGRSVDFKELRLSYSGTRYYNPYFDNETQQARKAMLDAERDQQYDKALQHARYILNKDYVDIKAHIVSQVVYQEMNNSKQRDFHRFVAGGLIKSILDSGDGKSPETAYSVIDVNEEYVILEVLGFKLQRQNLIEKNNHSYDEMEVIKPETGKTEVLYFNVDIPFNWMNKIFSSIFNQKTMPVEEWNKTLSPQ